MSGICEGRAVIITGAGSGLGREYALAFGAAGASVLVNDINAEAAETTAKDIESAGGRALPNSDDITDHEAAGGIVAAALERFGDLHVVVNNAGITRDRMFVSLSEHEWDEVIRVHLKGHFCIANHAARHWRQQAKAGAQVDARIVNTTSGAGLQGAVGQSNYSAAKGGIATLTLVQAAELGRYGVTANAIAPAARTGMTGEVFADMMRPPEEGFDYYHPGNVAPFVVWLGSPESRDVSGRVFEVEGGRIGVADGWRTGPTEDRGRRWEPEEIGSAVRDLIGRSEPPQKVFGT